MKILPLSKNETSQKNSSYPYFGCASCQKLAGIFAEKTSYPKIQLENFFIDSFTTKGNTKFYENYVVESFKTEHHELGAQRVLSELEETLNKGDESLFFRTLKFIKNNV